MVIDPIELDGFAFGSGLVRTKDRKVQIVETRSGKEEINGLWSHSRREYEITLGTNVMSLREELEAFWEGRRGSLYGFLLSDPVDNSSADYGDAITRNDQSLGTGNGVLTTFQLKKVFPDDIRPYTWNVTRPVVSSVLIAANGTLVSSSDYEVSATTGIVTFDTAPADTVVLTAGFEYRIPVRFDGPIQTVVIHADLSEAMKVTLVEIKE